MIKHRKGVININKKKMLFPVMALAVLAGGLLTVTNASAEDSLNPETSLVQKIADKFGLNKDEVQKVFEEDFEEHKIKMQEDYEKRLDQQVKEGKITEEQKQEILNKHKEIEASIEADRKLTPEELKAKLESKRPDLETWAKENETDIHHLIGPRPMIGIPSSHGPGFPGPIGPR